MKTRNVLIGIGIALVSVALVALVGGGWLLGGQVWGGGCRQPGWGMMDDYGSPWGMHTWSGGILMFLFWALIIGGVVLLVVGLTRPETPQTASRDESPLEVLKWRYAAGEIDRSEYEMMKELLSG